MNNCTGMASWYINEDGKTSKSLDRYEKSLQYLSQLIGHLTPRSRIAWMNQLPILEPFSRLFCKNCYTTEMKRYNAAAHRILRLVKSVDGQK